MKKRCIPGVGLVKFVQYPNDKDFLRCFFGLKTKLLQVRLFDTIMIVLSIMKPYRQMRMFNIHICQ